MLFQADMGKQSVDQVQRTFWAEHAGTSADVRAFSRTIYFAWRPTAARRLTS